MKERNVDKIKRLKHELGRWQKKVADQDKALRLQHRELMEARAGNQEVQGLIDGLLTAVVLRCGERAKDPDTGEEIGYNLELPVFSVEEMRAKYEIHARANKEAGTYVLGVLERVTEDDGADPA